MDNSIVEKDLADRFVEQLEALDKRGDRAALARLKRCAGRSLAECTEVYSLFYQLLPSDARGKPWLEDRCFLVASLFPLAPAPASGDLGASLRRVAEKEPHARDALTRRLGILLDCAVDELPFRLRQATTYLASREVGIDWRQLLRDLIGWESASRHVQKRWARSFFSATDASASTVATA